MTWVAIILVIATSGPPRTFKSAAAYPDLALCQDDLSKIKPAFARRFPGSIIRGRCEVVALERAA